MTIQRNSSEGLGAALLPLLVETDVSVPSPNIEVAWQIFFFLAEKYRRVSLVFKKYVIYCRGAWLSESEEHVTLDHEFQPQWGVEII